MCESCPNTLYHSNPVLVLIVTALCRSETVGFDAIQPTLLDGPKMVLGPFCFGKTELDYWMVVLVEDVLLFAVLCVR